MPKAKPPAEGSKDEASSTKGTRPKSPRRRPATRTEEPESKWPRWLRGWPGLAIVLAVLLSVGYAVHFVAVSVSNGTMTDLVLHVAPGPGGAALRCGPDSSPGACDAADPTVFRVGLRDRVHVALAAGGTAVDRIWLDGGPYALWPAGFSLDGTGCAATAGTPCDSTRFTAWSAGTFRILCDVPGVDDPLECGRLVVS